MSLRKTKRSLISPTDAELYLINELRNKFLSTAKNKSHLFYKQDIDRIVSDDWQCHRFLLATNGNTGNALHRLVAAMKWRKSVGVRDVSESDFPRECLETIPFGTARDGSTFIVLRVKYYRKFAELSDAIKKGFLYFFEYLDRNNNGNGVTALFDFRDAGMHNIDLDLAQFMRPIAGKYYPKLIARDLLCDLPWGVNGVIWFLLSLLPEEKRKLVHLVSIDQIDEYVDKNNIPCFLDGTAQCVSYYTSKNGPCFQEFATKLKISSESVTKISKHLNVIIKDVNDCKFN